MPYIGREANTGLFVELDSLTATNSADYSLQLNGADYFPETVNNLLVSINGVIQGSSTMALNGSTLTVGATLSSSDVIDFVRVFGNVGSISTPTDGSVTANKIGSGAVDLTSKVSGVLPVANGGTGATSFNQGFTIGSTFVPSGGSTAFSFSVPENIHILKIAVSQIIVGGGGYHTMKLGYNNTFPDGGYGGGLTTALDNNYYGNAGSVSQLAVGHGLFYQARTYNGIIDCYKVDTTNNRWCISSQFNSAGSNHDFNYSTSQVQLGSSNQLNEIQFQSASGNWNTSAAQFRLFSQ